MLTDLKELKNHVQIEGVTTPWGAQCIETTYDSFDRRLNGYKCLIVLDTAHPRMDSYSTVNRLTTMIIRFPRCILSEINTHRVFSRNSASSRARSLRTTINQVMDDPYIPLFTENAKGMRGPLITDERQLHMARNEWLKARYRAVQHSLRMLLGNEASAAATTDELLDIYYKQYYGKPSDPQDVIPNVHKQTVNRLLEPFMWHETLITSSYWNNFFKLRIDGAAQPEIQAIAILMRAAMEESIPDIFPAHVPFMPRTNYTSENSLFHYLKQSAAECARISYVDRSTAKNKDGADILASRLLSQGHMSPFEHQAIDHDMYRRLIPGAEFDISTRGANGNLDPMWVQGRHIFENLLGRESHV